MEHIMQNQKEKYPTLFAYLILTVESIAPRSHKFTIIKIEGKNCPKYLIKIREEMTKLLLTKTASKKPPIIDIELLPKDTIKRKMELSCASTK